MDILKPFQKPQKLPNVDKRATWIELFFDLAYVIVISVLAHELREGFTFVNVLSFTALLVSIYWSWVGHTFYNDRFDSDDSINRILTYIHMVCIGSIALFAGNAFTDGFAFVAGLYIGARATVIISFLRAGFAIPEAKRMAYRYAYGFTFALLPLLLAIFIPDEITRAWLMIISFVISFITPLLSSQYIQNVPINIPHIKERFGLFMIIMLGELLLSTIHSLEYYTITFQDFGLLSLDFLLPFLIWWLYFQNVDTTRIKPQFMRMIGFIVMHIIFIAGLIIMSVGIEENIEAIMKSQVLSLAETPNLLVIGGVLVMIALAMLDKVTTFMGELKKWERLNSLTKFIFAGLLILVIRISDPILQLITTNIAFFVLLIFDTLYRKQSMKELNLLKRLSY